MTEIPTTDSLRRAFAKTHVTVVGDVMSDEYLWGVCTRVSPEAPVPVVLIEERTVAPGGAANVAMGVVALGCSSALIGVVGADASGRHLAEFLRGQGLDPSGLLVDSSRPTTTKTRVIAGSQQVVRTDVESTAGLDVDVSRRLLNLVEENVDRTAAVVLSDYSKGVVTRGIAQGVIGLAKTAGVPVIVDPKGDEYDRFDGATLVTPNVHEVERATGLDLRDESELHRAGWLLTEVTHCAVLVTRGAHGMTLFDPSRQEAVDFPTRARAVFDVTGAGDTVVATMAVCLACGLSYEVGAHLAMAGAAEVIARVGTATASLEEIVSHFEDSLRRHPERE